MGENLREVIARIKAKQSSQTSKAEVKPAEKVKPVAQKIEDEEEDFDDDEEDEKEVPVREEKPAVKPKEQVLEASETNMDMETARQQQQEVMLLQDNGIFRVQMLHQLSEINKALVVIAGVLADLSGNEGTKA